MAGAKNLKARPKATPSRIQENIQSAKAIVAQTITDNDFVHIAETEELTVADLPKGNISVPLNLWLENKDEIKARDGLTACLLYTSPSPRDGLLSRMPSSA